MLHTNTHQLPAPVWHAPRASVIVVNYNGRKYLDTCLRALLDTSHSGVEIILVDNNSSDGSADHVGRIFPEIHVVRSSANLGFGGASNLGAQMARSAYLAFINPDTVVTPTWLEAMLEALERDPGAGLATSKILLLDRPDRINTGGNDVHLTGLTLCRGMGLEQQSLAELTEVSAVSGAAFVIRRDLFELLGGFDADFFLYMEDTDLSRRARMAGYRSVYIPTSVVYHDYRLRFGPQKVYYQERNRYLMLLKGLRWPTLLLLLPALLLAEIVTWGFVLLQERSQWKNKLRAYSYVWHNWQAIMERRRQAQAYRCIADRELLAGCTYRLAYEQTRAGPASQLARLVLDQLFFVCQWLSLAMIRW